MSLLDYFFFAAISSMLRLSLKYDTPPSRTPTRLFRWCKDDYRLFHWWPIYFDADWLLMPSAVAFFYADWCRPPSFVMMIIVWPPCIVTREHFLRLRLLRWFSLEMRRGVSSPWMYFDFSIFSPIRWVITMLMPCRPRIFRAIIDVDFSPLIADDFHISKYLSWSLISRLMRGRFLGCDDYAIDVLRRWCRRRVVMMMPMKYLLMPIIFDEAADDACRWCRRRAERPPKMIFSRAADYADGR